MLRADLDNENATIRAYRERVAQCEALQEYAIAEDIREILRQEQEHQIDLATALGEGVPNVSRDWVCCWFKVGGPPPPAPQHSGAKAARYGNFRRPASASACS